MAILVHDVYTTPSGVQLQNFVITTKGNILKIEKLGENSYRVLYELYYYNSRAFYNENKPYVVKELKVLTLTDCSVNIYNCFYEAIKTHFQHYENI